MANMKMKLDALPKALTEAAWKDHKSVFQNKTGVSSALRDVEAHYKECVKVIPDTKIGDVWKQMTAALEKARVAAGDCFTESHKSRIIPKKSADYAKLVNETAAKFKTHLWNAYNSASEVS